MSQITTRYDTPLFTTRHFDDSVNAMTETVITPTKIVMDPSLTVTVNPTSKKPISNQKIANVGESGFLIDVNNMVINKIYLINYDGSEYEIMKNSSGELEVFEVSFT